MRCLQTFILLLCLSLTTACSGRISLSDLATTAGAVGGAVVGAATGNPAVVIATTTAGGVAGGAVVTETVDTVDACAANPEICTTITTGNVIKDFLHWIVGGVVFLIIAAWLIPGPQLFKRRYNNDESSNSNRRD